MMIAWFTRRKNRRVRACPRMPYQPILEYLEGRETPSTVSIGATRDNSIFSENNNSDGASYDLFTGRTNQNGGATRRALVYFDLSGLPSGALINGVSLTMVMSGGAPSGIGAGDPDHSQGYTGPLNISLNRLLADWGAGSSGAGSGNGGSVAPGSGGPPGGSGGASSGFSPTTEDATWNYRLWNTAPWTTPGGDYVSTPSATQGVDINPQYVTWSSSGLTSDVQGWVKSPGTNFGWMILGDESTKGTSRLFVSSESPHTSYRPVLTIDYSAPPTDISLSSLSVPENQPTGTLVGSFSTTDPSSSSFTYTLVSGVGSTDNSSFTISGNQLLTAASFDYEAKSSYSIRVRSTDSNGLSFEKILTISITNIDEPPTDIALSPASVAENQPTGTVVGSLSSTDPDSSSFTYTLVSGTGSTDNSSFTISGNQLLTAASFNYEAKSSYSIRVQTKDSGGNTFEKVFTVGITDVNEPPTGLFLSSSPLTANQPAGSPAGTFSSTDPDFNQTFTYSLVPGAGSTDNGLFTVASNELLTSTVLTAAGNYSIRVRTTDQSGLSFDQVFTITVDSAPAAPPSPPASPPGAPSSGSAGRTTFTVVGADAGGAPQVVVYNTDGSLRFSLYAFSPVFTGGVRVASGDVNGDGVPDIIAAAGPGGGPQVAIYDGVTGALIRSFYALPSTFTGGVYVATGDVNHDGFADVIVGAGAGGGPQVTVYSGRDGGLLASFFALPSNFRGGVRVAAGDVNGDGRADIFTAAGPGGGPQVTVYDGATGTALTSLYALPASFRGGVNLAAGDVNGDGIVDIITGADKGGGPQVSVYNGKTGALLASFYALAPNFTGGVRVGFNSNFNGGGKAAILTSAGSGSTSLVTAFDTSTLATLGSFFAFNPAFHGSVFPAGN